MSASGVSLDDAAGAAGVSVEDDMLAELMSLIVVGRALKYG